MPRNKGSSKAPSQRQLKVGELIRHALAEMFLRDEVHDDVLQKNTISVTEIDMAPNLRNAIIYVVTLGGVNDEEVLSALNKHKRYIKGRIGNIVQLKYVPSIKFALDKTFDNYGKISSILNRPEIKRDIERDMKSE